MQDFCSFGRQTLQNFCSTGRNTKSNKTKKKNLKKKRLNILNRSIFKSAEHYVHFDQS